MKHTRLLNSIAALFVSLALIGCSKESTRWDDAGAQAETKAAAIASAKEEAKAQGKAVPPGKAFNPFFPKEDAEGKKRVFTTERDGYSEAKLLDGSKEIATLSISDTTGQADVLSKFEAATDKVGDAPLVTVGKNQSAALVAKRWQVKVSSQSLPPEERKAWLQRFDLSGLNKL